jgi:hypothetical protein
VAANRSAYGKTGRLAECIALGLAESPTFEFSYHPRQKRVVAATPWHVPRNRRVTLGGRAMLYLIRFHFPRYLRHRPLETLIHELLHISPRFDGSHSALRHGRWFERFERGLAAEWRRTGDPSLTSLMDLDLRELRRRFGVVACLCFRRAFHSPLPLPAPEGDWTAHPEVRRLGLAIAPASIRRLPFTFADPADLELTDKDLEYRVFHDGKSERISAALAEGE